MMKSVMILALLLMLGCQKKEEANNTFGSTLMYKDTISRLTPLKKDQELILVLPSRVNIA